jgi:hypothetical protein
MTGVTAARVVRFLGLSDLTENGHGDAASFPLGILYPYSRDLQRVCRCYDSVHEQCPEAASILLAEPQGKLPALNPDQSAAVTAYLASIATLHSQIAFAPGHAGESVGAAYRVASDTLVPTTRRGRRGQL